MKESGVRQCSKCGRLFMSYGASTCPDCYEEADNDFNKVKGYIYDHPQANVTEIARETGIDTVLILRFLREGRLAVKGGVELLNCEICGKSIRSGRYCQDCLNNLQGQLDGSVKEIRKEPIARMHVNKNQDR